MTLLHAIPDFAGTAQRTLGGPASRVSLLAMLGVGLILGMRHSTDADHVVALSTIVSQQRSVVRAALIGALWGVGHTITIVIVGACIILLHVSIPVRLGLAMEFSVGVMLVALGLLNLSGLLQRAMHRVGAEHQHPSPANPGALAVESESTLWGHVHALGRFHRWRPVMIGLVHGLAGSAAVALLVIGTIRDPRWAIAYLLIFGLGTILGMVLMTAAIAVPLTFTGKRLRNWNGYLANASGIISICFGSVLIYQLGFVQGLFTKTPHWVPQ